MAKFELISKYEGYDSSVNLFPRRKTAESAGYDFFVAEDTIIPPIEELQNLIFSKVLEETDGYVYPVTLDEMGDLTKSLGAKPTLVPTGVKAQLDPGTYLELSVRSSCPLKYWLIMANSVGIIDGDYYNNPDNDGHFILSIINTSNAVQRIPARSRVAQAVFVKYLTVDDDNATGERVGGIGSTGC